MSFETNVPINDYINLAQLKINELNKEKEILQNSFVQKKYNSFLNRFIFRQTIKQLNYNINYLINRNKTPYNPTLLFLRNTIIELNHYKKLLNNLNIAKELGNDTVKINQQDLQFFKK